jgi:elongation factor 1-alpha
MVGMVSICLVGGEAVGKSTAISHLCALSGAFEEDSLVECKELAKELGRPYAKHSWLMDSLPVEREVGQTLQPHMRGFEVDGQRFMAIDTPGRLELASCVTSVASLTDIAVLVVSAKTGEYEDGIESGRTKELALCCFTMGIKHIAVLVTKMDDAGIDFSGTRFDEIKKTVGSLLKEVGYKQKEPPFIPISGATGENLASKSSNFGWYAGPTAMDAVTEIAKNVVRPDPKPLRLPILKAHQLDGDTVIVGRVEAGSIRKGIKVLVCPSGRVAEVQSIQVSGNDVGEASTGEIVGVNLGDDFESGELTRGMVISNSTTDAAAATESCVAQVIIFDHPGKIRAGYGPAIATHTGLIPCEFEELISKIDRKTGKESEANPSEAKAGDIIKVRLRPKVPVCLETFDTYPSLGRFSVRDHGRTVAVGVIKEVTKRGIPKPRSGNENGYF